VFIFIPLPVPAFVLIGFWFLMQLFYSAASLGVDASTGGGIAYLAHVGGFVAGAAVIHLFMVGRRRAPPVRHVRRERYW
jgi:membrane associated rhomboid family serine protease